MPSRRDFLCASLLALTAPVPWQAVQEAAWAALTRSTSLVTDR
jgi:hypothetical protein